MVAPIIGVALREFGHAWGASFELNLAYSIVIKFGNFNGKTIDRWIREEKIRVIPEMAETPNFSEEKFSGRLDSVGKLFRRLVFKLNKVCVTWAILAGALDLLFLSFEPFHTEFLLQNDVASEMLLFVFGAVPTCFVISLLIHSVFRIIMRIHSWKCDAVVENSKDVAPEIVSEARNKLRERLEKEDRENGGNEIVGSAH